VVEAVRKLLGGIPASHLGFYAVPVSAAAGGAPAPARPDAVVAWRTLSPTVGYVRIASFPSGGRAPAALARLDSAFAALGTLPALVIDLRANPGGNLELGNRLADHLLDRPLEAGYFVTRAGLDRRGMKSIEALDPATLPRLAPGDSVLGANLHDHIDRRGGAVMLVAGGGAHAAYQGRVALLIDRGSGSTAEAVAAALGESGRVTLVGERTQGAMLASAGFPIADGWELRIPVADFRTAGRRSVEGKGVEPQVVVVRGGRGGRGDRALARAVEILGEPAP
jgi:C-terminal processing protease CtpA/Prc